MSVTLTMAERRPRKSYKVAWWYVGRAVCSFHSESGNIYVATAAIRRALAAMDKQLHAQPKRRP